MNDSDVIDQFVLNPGEKAKVVTHDSLRQGFSSLTIYEEAVVKWQFNIEREGSFKWCLWQTIMNADENNLERLERGFPIEVEGFLKYSQESGWWERVIGKIYDRSV